MMLVSRLSRQPNRSGGRPQIFSRVTTTPPSRSRSASFPPMFVSSPVDVLPTHAQELALVRGILREQAALAYLHGAPRSALGIAVCVIETVCVTEQFRYVRATHRCGSRCHNQPRVRVSCRAQNRKYAYNMILAADDFRYGTIRARTDHSLSLILLPRSNGLALTRVHHNLATGNASSTCTPCTPTPVRWSCTGIIIGV